MNIVEASLSDLEAFFAYLSTHLEENGESHSFLFQPIPKSEKQVSEQTRNKFRNGFDVNIGCSGWRKLWLAKDSLGNIKGHIDLRHHGDEFSFHRVLLGMGVDRRCRKQGIGERLVSTVLAFCYKTPSIDWLDLNVLSDNFPAKKLYQKCGFHTIGEIQDYYRIDGNSVSETTMTKSTKM
ncbi:GNAT family N-acetyltransferase [Vibrio sp. Of7-15]|uniref:GNAT family N-acetyltransferase n=1 Tax=Vibrio sp. Of7-15 TaxID=2724879 RepID=UPI001EF246DF|nr:N-acetyltransferase [Vibrio sp. Of7-15]MCG7497833.1 GNAT family N-acetyltransferase [Vibrio sp. Of7-15]